MRILDYYKKLVLESVPTEHCSPSMSPSGVLADSEGFLILTRMRALSTVFNYHPGIVIRNKDFQ